MKNKMLNMVVTFGLLLLMHTGYAIKLDPNQAYVPVSNNSKAVSPNLYENQISATTNIPVASADRLLQIMGQDPQKFKEYTRKLLSAAYGIFTGERYYWSDDPQGIEIDRKNCDVDGKGCTIIYKSLLTPQEADAFIPAIRTAYLSEPNLEAEESLVMLSQDIAALQKNLAAAHNSHLKYTLELLVKTAQKAHDQLKLEIANANKQIAMFDTKVADMLEEFLPTQGSTISSLSENLDQARLNFNSASKSEIAVYQLVIQRLEAIDRIIKELQTKDKTTEKALQKAQNKLTSLLKHKASGSKEDEDNIQIYKSVVAVLTEEVARERSAQARTKVNERIEAQKQEKKVGSAVSAHKKAQDDLKKLEKELSILRSDRASKEDLDLKEMEIKDMREVIKILEANVKDEQADETHKEKEIENLVADLVRKNNGDLQKTLSEAIDKVMKESNITKSNKSWKESLLKPKQLFSTNQALKNAEIIQDLKTKKEAKLQLSDKELIVLQIDKQILEVKMNDPYHRAVHELGQAKPLEIPNAVKNLVGAMLGKVGLSRDMLDDQKVTDIIKKSSDQLVVVLQNRQLSSQQKLIEKQKIIKEMLIEITAISVGANSGLINKAVQTGKIDDVAAVGLSAASNYAINYFTGPKQQTASDIDLSAL